MDHDRLFKELLSNFFGEFVDLFLPKVSAYLDRDAAFVAMDKEVFTDITLGEKHEVDVLMKAKFRGEETFFLIHVENQAKAQSHFPKRMFRYFARLTEKYDIPIYPVVIFSYDAPQRPEPNRYTVAFPNKTVLRFDYDVIQLNRLPWRRFVKQDNPVASALMAKMKMRAQDRPKVKAECLRLLASLRLDPAKSTLIGGFIDSYLELTAQEMKQYEREFTQFTPEERTETMELMTSWGRIGKEEGKKEGIREGIREGKEEMVLRQLRRRFGSVTAEVTQQLDRLMPEQLDDLGEALLDFNVINDLEQWLAGHTQTAN
ncbi:MAG: DUF4351 domain-containing protein [Capsulimonas sp.]|uniref:DUF4351 domain-containing protein n=1 Tax=Capsulimonas sp. TaxID=2494211 RepID=UPI00326700FD